MLSCALMYSTKFRVISMCIVEFLMNYLWKFSLCSFSFDSQTFLQFLNHFWAKNQFTWACGNDSREFLIIQRIHMAMCHFHIAMWKFIQSACCEPKNLKRHVEFPHALVENIWMKRCVLPYTSSLCPLIFKHLHAKDRVSSFSPTVFSTI